MPTIVLLPGLDGTGQLFADFVTALGPSVEVIVATYPTGTQLGYAELEPIARSFLPDDKPYFLLAESFSGPIAISIAASAPANLQGLILSCSFARNPAPVLSVTRPFLSIVPVAAVPRSLLDFFCTRALLHPSVKHSADQGAGRRRSVGIAYSPAGSLVGKCRAPGITNQGAAALPPRSRRPHRDGSIMSVTGITRASHTGHRVSRSALSATGVARSGSGLSP